MALRMMSSVKTSETDPQKLYKTYEVCKLFNVSRATLFRWEREGLISGPPRDWRNWRIYTTQNIKEITQIIQARNVTL
jgi:DNA-binding transcriptional MerR regulator